MNGLVLRGVASLLSCYHYHIHEFKNYWTVAEDMLAREIIGTRIGQTKFTNLK